ncbi:MAG TPA: phage tail protein, partial [Longimicrobiaceae bacterium]|nr:phage tail protein [Longimicrobiaceae bacterium]
PQDEVPVIPVIPVVAAPDTTAQSTVPLPEPTVAGQETGDAAPQVVETPASGTAETPESPAPVDAAASADATSTDAAGGATTGGDASDAGAGDAPVPPEARSDPVDPASGTPPPVAAGDVPPGDVPPDPIVPGSRLLLHLPAIYQTYAQEGRPNFVGTFLLAFEQILTGLADGTGDGGLDGRISGLAQLFDPDNAPAEFLEWLAGWVAMSLRADLHTRERREFIRQAVPLYRRRGTRQGMLEMIRIHTSLAHAEPGAGPLPPDRSPTVEIEETAPEFRLGAGSRVGHGAIGGGPPHSFTVRIWDSQLNAASRRRMRDIVTAIIEQEKPAHTVYTLQLAGPTLQIGVRSRVGTDTVVTRARAAATQPGTSHA